VLRKVRPERASVERAAIQMRYRGFCLLGRRKLDEGGVAFVVEDFRTEDVSIDAEKCEEMIWNDSIGIKAGDNQDGSVGESLHAAERSHGHSCDVRDASLGHH